jgi:hypothetical protein
MTNQEDFQVLSIDELQQQCAGGQIAARRTAARQTLSPGAGPDGLLRAVPPRCSGWR